MITPEEKDALLLHLTSQPNRSYVTVDILDIREGLDEYVFSSFVEQLEERGFVRILAAYEDKSEVELSVGIRADDFMRRGGFKFEEDVYINNFTKLELELAKLEGEISDEKFNRIMTLANTTAAAVSAYNSFS